MRRTEIGQRHVPGWFRPRGAAAYREVAVLSVAGAGGSRMPIATAIANRGTVESSGPPSKLECGMAPGFAVLAGHGDRTSSRDRAEPPWHAAFHRPSDAHRPGREDRGPDSRHWGCALGGWARVRSNSTTARCCSPTANRGRWSAGVGAELAPGSDLSSGGCARTGPAIVIARGAADSKRVKLMTDGPALNPGPVPRTSIGGGHYPGSQCRKLAQAPRGLMQPIGWNSIASSLDPIEYVTAVARSGLGLQCELSRQQVSNPDHV